MTAITNKLPLLALTQQEADTNPICAWQHSRPIHLSTMLNDIAQVAATLPAASHVVNACQDRYHFTVGFAAAMQRGQISVLPHNHLSYTLEQLGGQYPGLYCLSDSKLVDIPLPCVDYPGIDHPYIDGATSLSTLIPTYPSQQCAAILFTSGSTGEPQAHPRSWGSVVASGLAEAQRLLDLNTGTSAAPRATKFWSIVGTVPGQHSYGFESTIHLALQGKAALVAERPFFPADIVSCLRAIPAPRLLVTTPVHLRALLLEQGGVLAGLCEMILSATAPLPMDLAAQAEAVCSASVLEIYGSSESGQVATRRTLHGDTWQCFDGVQVTQDTQAIDRAWFSGGHVEKPHSLGDKIHVLDNQHFVLHGRLQDVVNIGGKRGSLQALNAILLAIPGVQDGCFALLGDESAVDRRLCAFVVAPTLTAEQLRGELRTKVEALFLPRPLRFVEALPRDANGKITAKALQALMSNS